MQNLYTYPSPDALAHLDSPKARYSANILAIRLLKQLELDKALPGSISPTEQHILAAYVGWGDTDTYNLGVQVDAAGQLCGELVELVNEAEFKAIRRSRLTGFYTPLPLAQIIWDGLIWLGLDKCGDGLKVLEPACGSGVFLSTMPDAIRSRVTHVRASEMDKISARITRYLHPSAVVHAEAFETLALPENAFDLVISNAPFGNIPIFDPAITADEDFLKRTLHDYFLSRGVRLIRPGGIVALLTSYGSLDKKNSRVREWIAERADLLAAMRLPSGTFAGNSGTKAGADLLFLRKRVDGESAKPAEWLGLGSHSQWSVYASKSVPYPINVYFTVHPEHVLGTLHPDTTAHGESLLVLETEPGEHLSRLPALLTTVLPQNSVTASPIQKVGDATGDKVLDTEALLNAPLDVQASRAADDYTLVLPTGLSASQRPRGQAMAALYVTFRQLVDAERFDASDDVVDGLRLKLNQHYDDFASLYGPLQAKTNQAVLKGMPELAFLLSLEEHAHRTPFGFQATKSAIFHRRTIRPRMKLPGILTPQDALLYILNAKGQLDLRAIGQLCDLPRNELVEALGPLIYEDPAEKRWVLADEYLSGNVRSRLRAAKSAALFEPRFVRNVQALEGVVPPMLGPGDIDAALGAPWIPSDVIEGFVQQLLPDVSGVTTTFYDRISTWKMKWSKWQEKKEDAQFKWGTPRANALKLIDESLQGRVIVVYDKVFKDGKTRLIFNQAETLAAVEKQDAIRQAFEKWIWDDADRAERLVRIYNDTHNAHVARRYDGSHLHFEGTNQSVLTTGDLWPQQKDAVWRILTSLSVLLAHKVGAGKTYVMAAAAYEAKRLGLAHKPMLVTLNNLVEQVRDQVIKLYPGIRVLAIAPEEFSTARRQEFCGRVATGDWDLVIMSQTSFQALHIAPSMVDTCFQPMIEELRQYSRMLSSNEDADGSKLVERNIAMIETRIEELKNRIQRDSERGITWERLGIDLLCVDEADAYKNLLTPTRMNRVAGLPGGNSHRAFDMKIKTWDLLKRNCRVVFATATPIANTIAEAHVMMRFLQESMLADLGVLNFDAWVQTFAAVKLVFEMKPDGSGFRFNHRLCEFRNVPELSQHIRQVWDIKMKEDLPYLQEPVMAGGKPIVIEVPASPAQRQYVQYLAQCMEDIHGGRADRHKLNALLVTYWGRLCALDIRLVRPDLPADDNNKIKTLVSLLSRHYHETHTQKGTQLVFCDLGVPKGKGGDSKKKATSKPSKASEAPGADRDQESSSEVETVDEIKKRNWVYHEIRRECVHLGIPIEQVAFIHEWDTPKKRPQLQRMMETGEIRILIASTQKGGAGLNIQPRLVAVYNLDAPWRPRDVEQRVGRALRQGNQWDEVYVYNIVTSGSFDAFIWQAIETKARFNHQLLRGTAQRRMMDVDAVVLSYAEVKAAASGNPKVRRQVYLSTELQRLEALRTAHANASYTMRREVSDIDLQLKRIAAARASEHRAKQTRDEDVEPILWVKDEQSTRRVDDKKALGRFVVNQVYHTVERLQQISRYQSSGERQSVLLGYFGVFEIRMWFFHQARSDVEVVLLLPGSEDAVGDKRITVETELGVCMSIEHILRGIEERLAQHEKTAAHLTKRRAWLVNAMGQPWEHEVQYAAVQSELIALNDEFARVSSELAPASPEPGLIEGDGVNVPEAGLTGLQKDATNDPFDAEVSHIKPKQHSDEWAPPENATEAVAANRLDSTVIGRLALVRFGLFINQYEEWSEAQRNMIRMLREALQQRRFVMLSDLDAEPYTRVGAWRSWFTLDEMQHILQTANQLLEEVVSHEGAQPIKKGCLQTAIPSDAVDVETLVAEVLARETAHSDDTHDADNRVVRLEPVCGELALDVIPVNATQVVEWVSESSVSQVGKTVVEQLVLPF